jgi:quinolinate synthase
MSCLEPGLTAAVLPPPLKERIDRSQMAREQIRSFRTVHLDYHPQESHLITFKDPWSFPILYHPECNNLVVRHMDEVAEKVQIHPFSAKSALTSLRLQAYVLA